MRRQNTLSYRLICHLYASGREAADVNRRTWLIGVVALCAMALFVYSTWLSPTVRVQKVADRFVAAITAGDLERVESMVAPGAMFSATQWIAKVKGMTPPRGTSTVRPAPENPCGIEMMAMSVVRYPDGTGQGLTLLFKQVQGQWLVFQGDGQWCPS